MRHLLTIDEFTQEEIVDMLDLSADVKANPSRYEDAMHRKQLLMIFDKPSLRTRLAFEAGMSQMGGHAIFYDTSTSPFGAGKETARDMIKVSSRFVDMIMARLSDHAMIEEMGRYAEVPVINALTNRAHPCQLLADLHTIREKKGRLKGLKIAYCGDARNNVTYSIMTGCTLVGMDVSIACPDDVEFQPLPELFELAGNMARATGRELEITHDPILAVSDADIVYTDSWMSYHIPKEKLKQRMASLLPFQVNEDMMARAKPNAIFMNCLPAMRGYEQSEGVIDGPGSVVFDQAENRLHAHKAVMIKLLEWRAQTTI